MSYRDYDPKKDLNAVRRIWKECGWIDDENDALVEPFFNAASDALVATINGEAECAVHSSTGDIRYLDEALKLGAVTAVTTSHVARKQGFAADLTARLLARQAEAGMEVSSLGMFEQGFYDRVGYGTGAYEHLIRFDPSSLSTDHPFRPPTRLNPADFEAVHTAMCNRIRGHGGVNLRPPLIIKAELQWMEKPFGLGYFDGPGDTLSHFVMGTTKGENGPYAIHWRAWQSTDQLLELLALIRSLGDQVNQVSMLEIGDIQLQDLLKQPFKQRRVTRGGEFVNESRTFAYWQLRVLDMAACLAKTRLNVPTIRFNVELTDPVEQFLDEGSNWRGIAGDYVVTLGQDSSAEKGRDKDLPTLNASVNAFSRMWFGIRSASSLAITDNLAGDESLLRDLDATLRLPKAHLGWDF